MRTLIINLTRFGDLLQSQAVIHALHDRGDEVGVVCLENFAPAASLLADVGFIAPLPGSRLLSALDAARQWPSALADLEAWIENIRKDFAPDVVLNLTSTLPARLLARRLAGESRVHGFGLDEHGFGTSGSAWTSFFEASTMTRGCSPFNLVDIFLKASGCQGPGSMRLGNPAQADMRAMSERLAMLVQKQMSCGNCSGNASGTSDATCVSFATSGSSEAGVAGSPEIKGYVAFQPGASEARRQWPAAFFAEIGKKVLAHFGHMPVLLGTRAELPLAEQYFEHGGPGLNLMGGTSLKELSALLAQTSLLLTNDTGTMHLAAGLGVPSLSVFLATAQPWDTGPYLEDCCMLEPSLACHPCAFGMSCGFENRCLAHITPEAVWPLVHGRLEKGAWQCNEAISALARVWISRRDSQGYMDLESISGHGEEDRTLWRRLQRVIIRQFLDDADGLHGGTGEAGKSGSPGERDNFSDMPTAPLSAGFRAEQLATLEQADALLGLCREQARLTMLRGGNHARQFLATCERVNSLFSAQPSFNAFGRLWQTLLQEHAANLDSLIAFIERLRLTLLRWQSVIR